MRDSKIFRKLRNVFRCHGEDSKKFLDNLSHRCLFCRFFVLPFSTESTQPIEFWMKSC